MKRATTVLRLLKAILWVTVAAQPLTAQASLGYRVQVVAVVDSALALTEARRLQQRFEGPCEFYVIRSDTVGVYRIQIGGLEGVSDAMEARRAAVALGYSDAFVVDPAELPGRTPVPSSVECVWWVPGESTVSGTRRPPDRVPALHHPPTPVGTIAPPQLILFLLVTLPDSILQGLESMPDTTQAR